MKTQAIVLRDNHATPQNVVMGDQPGPIITFDPVMQNVYMIGGIFPSTCAGYPIEGNVREGIDYGAFEGQFTGTLDVPLEADVKTGVQYGADGIEFTGTYGGGGGIAVPGVGNAMIKRGN